MGTGTSAEYMKQHMQRVRPGVTKYAVKDGTERFNARRSINGRVYSFTCGSDHQAMAFMGMPKSHAKVRATHVSPPIKKKKRKGNGELRKAMHPALSIPGIPSFLRADERREERAAAILAAETKGGTNLGPRLTAAVRELFNAALERGVKVTLSVSK